MVHIFYHNDADGKFSAQIAYDYYVTEKSLKDIRLYEMDYTKEFPFDEISEGDNVVILDYSIGYDNMAKLKSIVGDPFLIEWIDHHATAIDEYRKKYLINGAQKICNSYLYRALGSACVLTWEWYMLPDCDIPYYIRLVSDWDTWRHNMIGSEEYVLAFEATGIRPGDPAFWLIACDTEGLIERGKAMKEYRSGFGRNVCQHIGKVIDFEGLKVLAANIPHGSSKFFESVPDVECDAYMPYYFNINNHTWTYSMYSVDPSIDVSEICVKHGGGGHKNAAGFSSKELIPEIAGGAY